MNLIPSEVKNAEKRIRKANAAFGEQFADWVVEVGQELRVAQDALASHKLGFVEWCEESFGWSRQRAHQVMNAADAVLLTSTMVDIKPSSERQCRALLKAPAEEIADVWREVVETATESQLPITAKLIEERIKRRIEASKPKQKSKPAAPVRSEPAAATEPPQQVDTEPEPPDVKPAVSIVLDAIEREVPAAFREAHQLGVTLLSIGRELDKFRQRAVELSEEPGGEWLQLQDIDNEIRVIKARFQQARYHTLCPGCDGDRDDGKGGLCPTCSGRGFLPDYLKATVR